MINTALLAQRRIELELSRTDLARLTGLSWDVIARLETDTEPMALTLDAARRLASALAVDLTSIAGRDATDPTPDDVLLEALLAHAYRPMSITDIARVLRWSLTRAQQALERLTRRLLTTGHAIRRVHLERYELAARGNIVRPAELARMRRQESKISTDDARLLLRLITGRDRDRLWEDTDQRAGVARLAGHDLVQPAGCWVSLSYEGEFNLQPDLNRTGPHGVQWPLRSPRAAHAD